MTMSTTTPVHPPEADVTPAVFSHATSDQSPARPTSGEHAHPVWFSAPAERPRR